MPYNSNDNTRVNRPLIQEPIKYKLQPGEVKLPSGQIIKVKQAELSQGSSEPKVLRDKRHEKLTRQHEQQKQKEREAFTIQGLTAPLQLISPSHIIGSANSNKPFLESYLGDSYNSATGNMIGDLALDAVVGGGLWKGAKVAGDLSRAAALKARPYIIANRLNKNINKNAIQETGYLTTPPKEIQITGINKPSEDGAMVFYQRPSKLKDAEKAGIPKGERNLQTHGQAQEPYYDYSLINRHNGIWEVDERGRFVFQSPEVSKKLGTIHFSLNNPVETHIGGSWQGMPTTILLPYRNVRSQVRPASLAIMDTFFPNYKGLKFSSRGAKVFTGDRKAFEYYKNKGIDVEFSDEMEGYLKRLDEINNKIHTYPPYAYRHQYPEDLENLIVEKDKLEDLIGNLNKNFSDKYAKKLPNYEAVKAWGKSEGLKHDFMGGLAQKKSGNELRWSEEYGGLDYEWGTDPSNHSGAIEGIQGIKSVDELPKSWFSGLPEEKNWYRWMIQGNNWDYRKRGGRLIKKSNI